MALPTVQSSGGLDSIAQLMQALGPLLGTGKQSTNRQTGALPTDIESTNDLINQILGSVSGDNLDVLTQNVLTRAKQTFAPANILPNAAGIRGYSDTVKMSLQNEAMARATAEAMQVRLQAQGAAQKTAAGLTETKVQANKSDNTQQKTGANNAGKLLSLAMPAAMVYNQFQKRKPADAPEENSSNTTDPVIGAPDNTTTDPSGQIIASDINTNIGGLADDSILPSESVVPDAIDFTGSALDDQVAENTRAESADMDQTIASDANTNIGGEAPVDDFDFSDFDLEGLDFFADGGVVPGRRAPPGSYDSDAMAARSPLVQSPRLALGTSSNGAVIQPATKSKKSIPLNDILQDNSLEGKLIGNGDSGEASTPGVDAGAPPAGLGLGISGIGHVGTALGLGIGPVAGLAAIGVALANAISALSAQANSTPVGPAAGPNPGTDDAPPGLSLDADTTSSLSSTDAPPGPTPGEGLDADGSTPSGESPGDSSDSSGDSAGDGGASASGDGSGAGGDDFDGDPTVKPRNATDMMGIDRVPIHVTPGEAVLPIDTVAALGGEDAIDMLIAATHTPIRKRANGRR